MKYLAQTSIARICHEANREYCASIGDPVPQPWEECSTDARKSTILGVMAHDEDLGLTPERSHELWVETKTLQGWTWGYNKDEEAKTHPCMISYRDLSPSQQMKDRLFGAICKVLLKGES